MNTPDERTRTICVRDRHPTFEDDRGTVSSDRKFMKKIARALSWLACTAALCLGGCISPDLEPPVHGGNNLPAPGTAGPRDTADSAAAGSAATVTPSAETTGSQPATTKPATTPTSGPSQSATAGTTAPAVPVTAPDGQAPTSGAAPGAMTGSAGAAGGVSDGADAGVETP